MECKGTEHYQELWKLACSFICLHAVSYACKQFHEFACSSLEISISLSSS